MSELILCSRSRLDKLLKMAQKVAASHSEPFSGVGEGEPIADDIVVEIQDILKACTDGPAHGPVDLGTFF